MSSGQRSVAFQTVLANLLNTPAEAGHRKKLARAIGKNEATISHYLRGRIKPSFEVLLAIAEYFNVSLDYLVFGERPATPDQDDQAGMRAHIRRAVVEASDLRGRQLDMVARISRRLQTHIDVAARELVENRDTLGPVGFVTDAEAIGMEACITRMRIMTALFQSDTNDGEPGAFFEVVAENLRMGRPYQYLLYGERAQWLPQVAEFRELIQDSEVPMELAQENLQFRWLPEELVTSVCILDLDMQLLERREPILLERHRDNISPEGVWAYLSIERADAQGGVAIEPLYRESTLRQFTRDWRIAKPL
ncbi:helix-turn-helix transcriptional regulator [Actinoplanes sp. LDG1-06]|uniref:Helix-turn-helix transcriptional regulator n=1 Tax=Paractinoplanes ovalisporus TaxID=2810368 RepID=A0ABS2AF40_9ACTN|nr:helix-turn-helix transcriptional regulator [Actinoplanes ovalisporus]MBM2618442.1 helix-turn-helix transcriptional regulator [Actinoplanes ovalisporus]